MQQFNLVVVSPFLDFKKGALISNAEMVANILNPSHEYHEYEGSVRRVKAFSEDNAFAYGVPNERRELVSIAKCFDDVDQHADELDE